MGLPYKQASSPINPALFNSGKSTDIASASTTDLNTATGNYVEITGTATITSFGTVAAGALRWLRFMGAVTLTHNATSLILPGARNIVAAVGDRALFVSLGSGNWECHEYLKIAGFTLGQFDEVTIATSATLTVPQVYGTQINNAGQTLDLEITLLPPTKGMNFVWRASKTVAKYVRFIPNTGGKIFLDGASTGINKYVTEASITKLDAISFSAAWDDDLAAYIWNADSGLGSWSQQA